MKRETCPALNAGTVVQAFGATRATAHFVIVIAFGDAVFLVAESYGVQNEVFLLIFGCHA